MRKLLLFFALTISSLLSLAQQTTKPPGSVTISPQWFRVNSTDLNYIFIPGVNKYYNLTTKEYVDAKFNTLPAYVFSNGLTADTTSVKLGGQLDSGVTMLGNTVASPYLLMFKGSESQNLSIGTNNVFEDINSNSSFVSQSFSDGSSGSLLSSKYDGVTYKSAGILMASTAPGDYGNVAIIDNFRNKGLYGVGKYYLNYNKETDSNLYAQYGGVEKLIDSTRIYFNNGLTKTDSVVSLGGDYTSPIIIGNMSGANGKLILTDGGGVLAAGNVATSDYSLVQSGLVGSDYAAYMGVGSAGLASAGINVIKGQSIQIVDSDNKGMFGQNVFTNRDSTTYAQYGGVKVLIDSVKSTIIPPDLSPYQLKSEKAQANGYASLGSDGKIPNAQIPALAISETFPVTSQAEMLAISGADQGDVAIRSDINKSFILKQSPASTLSNWFELLSPTDAVQSVNGKVGTVSVNLQDITTAGNSTTTSITAANLTGTNTGDQTLAISSTGGELTISGQTAVRLPSLYYSAQQNLNTTYATPGFYPMVTSSGASNFPGGGTDLGGGFGFQRNASSATGGFQFWKASTTGTGRLWFRSGSNTTSWTAWDGVAGLDVVAGLYQTLANLATDLTPTSLKYPNVDAVIAGIAAGHATGQTIGANTTGSSAILGMTSLQNANTLFATPGVFGITNTTGSTNYPATVGAGISIQRSASNALGTFQLWKSTIAGNTDVYYRTGNATGGFGAWDIVAGQGWVGSNYTTTTANNAALALKAGLSDANVFTATQTLTNPTAASYLISQASSTGRQASVQASAGATTTAAQMSTTEFTTPGDFQDALFNLVAPVGYKNILATNRDLQVRGAYPFSTLRNTLYLDGRISGTNGTAVNDFVTLGQTGTKQVKTASGNGVLTTISIAHGMTGVTTTSWRSAIANNAASGGISYVTVDATNINIFYTVAPVLGTNNLEYSIEIKP